MPVEILLGRALAFGVHPYAAWARLTLRGRALLVGGYCGASYAIVLGLLLAL